MKSKLLASIEATLIGARRTLVELEDGEVVEHEGVASGDLHDDREIRADRILGEYAQKTIASWNLPVPVTKVMVEGLPTQVHPTKLLSEEDGLLCCVDPLDGSLNYELRGNHKTPAPFSFVLTVLRTAKDPHFSDIIAAGLIDLRRGDMWLAERGGDDNRFRTTFNGQNPGRLRHEKLDLGKMILLGEMYYPDNRHMLTRALGERKGYLRSFGSAALEMAYVASGLAAGFICKTQKQHELGAAFAIALGAGCYVSDFEGKPLDMYEFIFEKTQTPVIIACTLPLGIELTEMFGP